MKNLTRTNLKQTAPRELFLTLLLLTALLFLSELAISLLMSNTYDLVVSAILGRLSSIPKYVWAELFGYWFLQIVWHIIFAVVVFCLTVSFSFSFRLNEKKTWWLGILLWFLMVFTMFFANQILYPNTLLGHFFCLFFSVSISKIILNILLIIFTLIFFMVFIFGIRRFFKRNWLKKTMIIGVILGGIIFGFYHYSVLSVTPSTENNRPNVLIIGIDGLRPNRLGYYGYQKIKTPTLDHLLSHAANFSQSLTPLARTSPAWISILTGQYPKHNSMRFDLMQTTHLDVKQSLALILKQRGYQTVFATDGRQFNSIDENYGFDRVIGPSVGASNFLMNIIGETLMSDLIDNTLIGKWIYPNIYGNRDIDKLYNPSSFLNELEQQVPVRSKKPLFLCVHFTLPHYPYSWSSLVKPVDVTNAKLYDDAVSQADKQLALFLNFLKRSGILNHAIVVLLSDHGEALMEPGDRIVDEKHYISGAKSDHGIFEKLNAMQSNNQSFNFSIGHGTDILSFTQYRTLLSFIRTGEQPFVSGLINNPVSLIDIKPTILHLLNVKDSQQEDGVSLAPYLKQKKLSKPSRMLFIESGFTPLAIKSSQISIQNAVLQSIDVYAIEPGSGKVVMKPETAMRLLKTKQRAVYYKDWVLAQYVDRDGHQVLVLVNRKTGEWTDDLSIPFALNSPVVKMFEAFKKFYKTEINFSHLDS